LSRWCDWRGHCWFRRSFRLRQLLLSKGFEYLLVDVGHKALDGSLPYPYRTELLHHFGRLFLAEKHKKELLLESASLVDMQLVFLHERLHFARKFGEYVLLYGSWDPWEE
jgi:hypothetical protein